MYCLTQHCYNIYARTHRMLQNCIRISAKSYGLCVLVQTIFLGNLTRLESSHMRERLLKFLAFKVVMVAAVWSAALEDSPFWLPM